MAFRRRSYRSRPRRRGRVRRRRFSSRRVRPMRIGYRF